MSSLLSQAYERVITRVQRMRVRRQFRQHMGYEGNFENPRSHQEKVQFRKLYGNHRFYAFVSDKYRVRQYVAGRVGDGRK